MTDLPLAIRDSLRPRASPRAWRATSAEIGRATIERERLRERWTNEALDAIVPAGEALTPVQRDGLRFVLARTVSLNAAPMGAGKTIMGLMYLNALLPVNGLALIVIPAFLRRKWGREAERWLARRFRFEIIRSRTPASLPRSGVIVASYETVTDRIEELMRLAPFHILIVDEGHFAKNPQRGRTQALRRIDNHRLIVRPIREATHKPPFRAMWMTGTPIFNRPPDLYTYLASGCPEAWGDASAFARAYRITDPKNLTPGEQIMLDETAALLRDTIMWRPAREEVLASLPPKPLPELILVDIGSTDAIRDRELALLRERAMHPNRSVAVFAQLKALQLEVAERKLPALEDQIDLLIENELPFLIFSQHRRIASHLGEYAATQGAHAAVIHGGFSHAERDARLDAFTAGSIDILSLTMAAGGAGLDLQRAEVVIFAELDWSPAVIDQAEGRAWRLGQMNPLRTIYMVAPNTIDATMAATLSGKDYASAVAQGDLSPDRLLDVLNDTATVLGDLSPRRARSHLRSEPAGSATTPGTPDRLSSRPKKGTRCEAERNTVIDAPRRARPWTARTLHPWRSHA